MTRRWLAAASIAAVLVPAVAHAQSAPAFRPGRVMVSAGADLFGGHSIGDVTASLRRNAIGTPPLFTLLRAESEIERAVGLNARVAVPVTRTLAIEVAGGYATPQLGVTISQDPELSAGAFASERLSQYVVDASAVYLLPIDTGARVRPYAIGGAGYLRQLHEGRLRLETGRSLHAGGGVQFWMRGANGRTGPLGVRAEARYVRRTGGISFDTRAQAFGVVSALAFVGF
jgi:hypothetical protein